MDLANAIFKSTTTLQEGVKVEIMAGEHKIIIDEPESLGGTDQGMNPLEALLGTLGACKCICARVFAGAHGIDLQDLAIDTEGDLDPDGFMGVNKEAKIGFSEIRTKVKIKSNSSEEEIKKFIDFIDRTCPVQDTMTNPPIMKTEFVIEK